MKTATTSPKILLSIEGCDVIDHGDGSYSVLAFARVDSDGTGPHHGDRTAQNHTSYQPDLNADVDPYVVVPPQFRQAAKGVVMGCRVVVLNTVNGKRCEAVVGDVGPRAKFGELSCACAKAIGLNPSPVSGGSNARTVHYTFWPGVPAKIGGRTYRLQAA